MVNEMNDKLKLRTNSVYSVNFKQKHLSFSAVFVDLSAKINEIFKIQFQLLRFVK